MPNAKAKQFKYPKEYVRHRLSEMISQGRFSKHGVLPSEQRLAEMLGVSRTPVRTVIKEMTRNGILRQVDNRGYALDRHTAFPENPMKDSIVLVSDFTADRARTTYMPGDIHLGVERAAGHQGRNIFIVYNVKSIAGPSAPRWFFENRPGGVLTTSYISENPDNRASLLALRDAGIPVIVPGDAEHLSDFDRVVADQTGGAYALMKHLLSLGCKRVVRLSLGGQDIYWVKERDRGYRKALREAKKDPEPTFVDDKPNVDYNPKAVDPKTLLPWTTGILAPLVLDEKRPIDAVICPSDGQCVLIGKALETLLRGRKHRVLVAGFDNYWRTIEKPETRKYAPAVTVDTAPGLIGEAMVELLQERIERKLPKAPQLRRVKTQLVVLDRDARAN